MQLAIFTAIVRTLPYQSLYRLLYGLQCGPGDLPRLSLQDGDELIGANVAFVFGPFRCREFPFG